MEERAIRVFVSSTFRDMAAERDVLVNHSFPRIRALCADRGVAFTEIDLRWGLTDEEVAEGEVLPICLREIRRCRPYFIGLLGERYGWVPPAIPDRLRAGQSWLIPHAGHSSVTELEILHGVLNDPEMDHNAFFYIRDAAYIGSPRFLADTDDDPGSRSLFQEPGAEARQKLLSLKDRLRESHYPVRDFGDPDQLGELVVADLTAMVERKFPAGDGADPLAAESRRQVFFATSRARSYVRRPAYFEALDELAERADGAVMTVLGDSGLGKSSLLATWGLGYRSRHPEVLVLMHFAGSSPSAGQLASLLARLNRELGRRLGLREDGSDSEGPDPVATFRQRLLAVAARDGVVLVLDALDQLAPEGDAGPLDWLPAEVPPGARLVLSTLKGPAYEELARRGWLEGSLRIRPLERAEREELVRIYLGQALAKDLSNSQLGQIVDLPQAESPLYLRILLDELRLWGRHETLGSRIERLSGGSTVSELLELVLARYEQTYESARPQLVGDAMRLLWASQQGLAESELLDLLGTGGSKLPAALWAPLRIAAAEMLLDREGLIGFAHAHFRAAVEARYLADSESRTVTRAALAAYFDPPAELPLTDRALAERPAQLVDLEAWEDLARLLTTPRWFIALSRRSRLDLRRLWAKVEANSQIRVDDAYGALADDALRSAGPQFAIEAGEVLPLLGSSEAPLHLLELALREAEEGPSLARACLVKAFLHRSRGELGEALDLAARAEQMNRRLGDRNGVADCLNGQALIRLGRSELEQSRELYAEAEATYRELGDADGLADTLEGQAYVYKEWGELERALGMLGEAEELYLEIGDVSGLADARNHQAGIRAERGEFDRALELNAAAERVYRELGDPAGRLAALTVRASIHLLLGELERATELYAEAADIARELGEVPGLATTLSGLGESLRERGEPDRALQVYAEAEGLYRDAGDRAGVADTLAEEALAHRLRGDPERALELHAAAERAYRALGMLLKVAGEMNNRATVYEAQGELEPALRLYEGAEELLRELGEPAALAVVLDNMARVSLARGEATRALDLHAEAERVASLGDDGVAS
ncbi:MAG TPA: tetratricopeptide repeat protein [Solirubrobacterales bacterium]|jgi:tetratricopeptide (TPR) repeat protein